MSDIKLIVGLGNPGKTYERTRHNAGFMAADLLAEKGKMPWKGWSRSALIARAESAGVLIVKPQTFMNLSGTAVQEVAGYFRISANEVLVILDDFSLPLGTLRLRMSGSAGGHNGLSSIIEQMGTSAIPRLRLGIGPVPAEWDPADFVLASFSGTEKEACDRMIRSAVDTVTEALSCGIEKALQKIAQNNGSLPEKNT